jgi:hypothetical protein
VPVAGIVFLVVSSLSLRKKMAKLTQRSVGSCQSQRHWSYRPPTWYTQRRRSRLGNGKRNHVRYQ